MPRLPGPNLWQDSDHVLKPVRGTVIQRAPMVVALCALRCSTRLRRHAWDPWWPHPLSRGGLASGWPARHVPAMSIVHGKGSTVYVFVVSGPLPRRMQGPGRCGAGGDLRQPLGYVWWAEACSTTGLIRLACACRTFSICPPSAETPGAAPCRQRPRKHRWSTS